MAITQCPQGHLYDTAIYQSCPYCGGSANMIRFDQPGGTVAPASYGAQAGYGAPAYGSTVAPANYGAPQSMPNRTVPVGGAGENTGKTVVPESYRKKQEEENKTVSVFRKTANLEPVVGWLACVDGPERGKSYELFAKINAIGRSSENDVCIASDSTISRKSHARLAYDPKHNEFRLIPDEGTNNIYLNEEAIYTPSKLEAFDLIELGQTKLVFVPLCGEHFRWGKAAVQE